MATTKATQAETPVEDAPTPKRPTIATKVDEDVHRSVRVVALLEGTSVQKLVEGLLKRVAERAPKLDK